MRNLLSILVIAFFAIVIVSITWPELVMAHHGKPGETAAQAKFRDLHAVKECDKFRYDGASPDNKICRALLSAVHRVKRDGRTAKRNWIYKPAFLKLLKRESGYAHASCNGGRRCGVGIHNVACGMGQMLPCDKYGRGSCWPSLYLQAECFVRYVLGRYRTPENAWRFWILNHWY